ncbi:MAG: hypothetical protein WKF84_11120 [Pyrinomonadaceae bacterium]
MRSFILQRLIITVPMILIVISLTWVLIRLAPGSFYSSEKALPAAVERNIKEKYGLNERWYIQYGRLMSNILLRGDFGTSLKYEGQSVNEILKRTLPVSATLGLISYFLALLVGVTVGTLAALKQSSWVDYSTMAFAMLGISVPNFVLAPILVFCFSLTLSGFPSLVGMVFLVGI